MLFKIATLQAHQPHLYKPDLIFPFEIGIPNNSVNYNVCIPTSYIWLFDK